MSELDKLSKTQPAMKLNLKNIHHIFYKTSQILPATFSGISSDASLFVLLLREAAVGTRLSTASAHLCSEIRDNTKSMIMVKEFKF
jgi:hypothetical protein